MCIPPISKNPSITIIDPFDDMQLKLRNAVENNDTAEFLKLLKNATKGAINDSIKFCNDQFAALLITRDFIDLNNIDKRLIEYFVNFELKKTLKVLREKKPSLATEISSYKSFINMSNSSKIVDSKIGYFRSTQNTCRKRNILKKNI